MVHLQPDRAPERSARLFSVVRRTGRLRCEEQVIVRGIWHRLATRVTIPHSGHEGGQRARQFPAKANIRQATRRRQRDRPTKINISSRFVA